MRTWRDVQGFTLVEALVAMVLATVVVMLVTSAFVVQNRFYSDAIKRTGLHESVRGATFLLSADLRGVSEGGVVVADEDVLAVRAPVLIGAVCGLDGNKAYVFLPAEEAELKAEAVDGFAVKDARSEWRYTNGEWNGVFHSSGGEAAGTCARSGADTTGAVGNFFRLDGLSSSPSPKVGDLVMLFRELEFRLAPSALVPGSRALFRGPRGEPLTELATGFSSRAGFEYALAGRDDFRNRINGRGNLGRVDRVRLHLEAIAPASDPQRDSLTFDLTLTLPLAHAN